MLEDTMAAAVAPASLRAGRREVHFRGGGFLPVPRRLHSWIGFVAHHRAVAGGDFAALGRSGVPALARQYLRGAVAASRARAISGAICRPRSCASARAGSSARLWASSVGVAMGLSSVTRAVGMPLVSAIYPIPKIALLPLLILWLGIGEAPKIDDHRLGRVLPHHHRDLHRRRFGAAQPHPHGAELQHADVGDHLEDHPALGAARHSCRLPHLGRNRAPARRLGRDDRRAIRHRRLPAHRREPDADGRPAWPASSSCRCWGWASARF